MLKRTNEGNYEYEISIKDFIDSFKRFWILILATAFVVGAAAYAYFQITYVKNYTSTVQFLVYNSNMEGAISDNFEYDKAEQLTTTYIDILTKSTSYLEKIVEDHNLDLYGYTANTLRSKISISYVGNSKNYFKLSVKDPDPRIAVVISSAVAATFKSDIVYAGDVRVIEEDLDYTKLASDTSRAPTMAALAFVVSFALMLALVTFICVKDTKIHSPEILKEIFSYPLIGTIPCIDKVAKLNSDEKRRIK